MAVEEIGFVYIMTNRPRGVLYTGVTSDLEGRVSEHRQSLTPGFTSKYQCKTLVWYERHHGIEAAISREKAIKKWRRDWKLDLIEGFNPAWDDLFPTCYAVDNPSTAIRAALALDHSGEIERVREALRPAEAQRLAGEGIPLEKVDIVGDFQRRHGG